MRRDRAIYHITTRTEAESAARRGEYVPARYGEEGFIHASYREQLVGVADARFKGACDLVILEIDRAALPCRVVDENLEGGEMLFPHIYGVLPMRCVVGVHPFACGEDGAFVLPFGWAR